MSLFSSTPSLGEMSFLVTSLGRTYSAGIPVVRCFSLFGEGSGSRVVRRIAKMIGADIAGGATLMQALEPHKRRFPAFFLGMVAIAEETGTLGSMLDLLARYYENMLALHRNFERQVTYPVVVLLGVMIGVPIVVRILSSLVESGDANLFYSIAMFFAWRVLGIVVALSIVALVYRIPGVRGALRTVLFYFPPFERPIRRLGLAGRWKWRVGAGGRFLGALGLRGGRVIYCRWSLLRRA